jgi:hypothetical protein
VAGRRREEIELKQRRFRSINLKLAVTASLAVVVAIAVFGPGLAAGSAETGSTAANTVLIEGSKKSPLKFVYPKTIVGPHTFAMVEESEVPRTAPQRKKCFTPKHICMAIAKWHGVKGPEAPVTINPAKAGKPGWDTEGSLSKEGDSWFTGLKPGSSFTQRVTADTSKGPTTITFICAIHPWMHGSIEVLPKN